MWIEEERREDVGQNADDRKENKIFSTSLRNFWFLVDEDVKHLSK